MNGIGIGIGINSGIGGFNINKDLALQYTSRSGLDLLETKSGLNLNGKIIPVCGKFDGSNYCKRTVSGFSSLTAGFIEVEFYYNGTSTPIYIFSSGDESSVTRYFSVGLTAGKPTILARSTTTFNTMYQANSALTAGWYIIRYAHDGSNHVITVNGNVVAGTLTGGVTKWIGDVAVRDNIALGILAIQTPIYSQTFYLTHVNFNDTNKWYVNGSGIYEYDVVGGAHMTWTGTANKYYAIDLPSTALQMLNVGYTLYEKDGAIDEYVPYASANTPYDASAFLSTYTKVGDKPGGTTFHNLAFSLIDFDYADGASAFIAELDRSNTTIWEDAARSLSDYDATNVYRFLAKNIFDPRIYYTLRKVGYKGKYHAKITNSTLNIVQQNEILLYTEDYKNSNEFKIMQYCNIDDFAIIEDGQFIVDENGYVIII